MIFWMSIDAKSVNKSLADRTQQYIKKDYTSYIYVSNIKLFSKAIIVQTVLYWH